MNDSGTALTLHRMSTPDRRARRRRQPMSAQSHEPETQPGADGSAASFTGSTGSPSHRRIGLVVVGAALLAVAAAATSMAASPTPTGSTNAPGNAIVGGDLELDGPAGFDQGRFGGRGFRDITITAISGNDVTLGTPDGWRRTVTVTASLNLTKGGQDIAIGDLKVGDSIRFRQVRKADGTFTVTDLAVVVPTIRGEVSAVTSSGFKLTTRDGSVWTVTVTGSTKYSFGQGDGTLADVRNGTTALVSGTTTGDNAITALGVRVKPDRAVGTVTAKTADSITIKKPDGSSLTIHVDTGTTFRVAGADNAKLSDIAVDMAIGVTGRTRTDGSLDADGVVAGKLRGIRGGNAPKWSAPGLFLPGFDRPTTDGAADSPSA
jgi:uncharacterized protein DUF5666